MVHERLSSRNDQDSKSRFLAVVTNMIGLNLGAYSSISKSRFNVTCSGELEHIDFRTVIKREMVYGKNPR